jgi:hypothetical protein
VVQSLADADRFTDQIGFSRRRQPVKAQAAFVITVLGDAAEWQPAFDVSPPAGRLVRADDYQEAFAVSVDVAMTAPDNPIAAAIAAQ